MRRSYRVDRYRSIIEKVRSAMPHATITTDIIVGFPGESEADFQETMDLVTELRFLAAYSFQYSKRPGTPAAEMPDQISPEVIADRYSRLHQRLNEVSLSVNEEVIGKEVELLVTDIDDGKGTGKSRDFRLVHCDLAGTDARPGDLVTVEISSAKPHFIFAEEKPLSIVRTRGGDAFEARTREAQSNGVLIGMPILKSVPKK